MPCCTTNTTVSKFFTALNRNSVPINSPVWPLPPALVTSSLLSVPTNLPIPDVSYEENHMIFVLCVWFILLSTMFSSFIHVSDFISFHGRTALHCTCTPNLGYPFICSKTLWGFPLLTMVNDAAVNTDTFNSFNSFGFILPVTSLRFWYFQ